MKEELARAGAQRVAKGLVGEMRDELNKGIVPAEMQRRGVKSDRSENEIGSEAIDAAIEVHRELGNGLLESVYENALAMELENRGLEVEIQVPVDVAYKGEPLGLGFRADVVVENKVLIELKSVETLTQAHRKQIQTYLRLAGHRLGYLFNFGAPLMKNGIVRCVNGLLE